MLDKVKPRKVAFHFPPHCLLEIQGNELKTIKQNKEFTGLFPPPFTYLVSKIRAGIQYVDA
ncbi:hypothetical protein CHI07_00590 [Paenibacillus sp. 7884-2]|nr:hypothetical protein CHI07_00590 [Paenibacillus sp. 7884-2]